jgi:hypothetical protein
MTLPAFHYITDPLKKQLQIIKHQNTDTANKHLPDVRLYGDSTRVFMICVITVSTKNLMKITHSFYDRNLRSL